MKLLLVIVCCALLGASLFAMKHTRNLAIGTWGGEGISMQVSEKGAEIEFDCAHGQIAQPILLDSHGNFAAAGTFAHEHGGPVLRDEKSYEIHARYSGHVARNVMSLVVAYEGKNAGTFTLELDHEPNLRKCR